MGRTLIVVTSTTVPAAEILAMTVTSPVTVCVAPPSYGRSASAQGACPEQMIFGSTNSPEPSGR